MNANLAGLENEMKIAFPGQEVEAVVTPEGYQFVKVPYTADNARLLNKRGYYTENRGSFIRVYKQG